MRFSGLKKDLIFFMIGSCLMMALKGPQLLKKERNFIIKNQIAGVTLFKRNIKSFEQVFKLNKQIKALTQASPLIAVDMEGGLVNRFSHLKKGGDWPSPEELSCLPPEKIFLTAKKMAQKLKKLGFDLNFAPVVDIPVVKSKLLKTRVFGTDPQRVLRLAGAFLKGIEEEGLISCLKHFPSHGGVKEDSHKVLPVDNRSLKELSSQLLVFQKLFQKKFPCIMTAHIEFPKIEKKPATFSKKLLTELLKKKLGFKGLIISDDIDMKALQSFGPGASFFLAVKAGCDMVISCQNEESPLKIIDYFEKYKQKKAEIKKELNQSIKRIESLKKKLG